MPRRTWLVFGAYLFMCTVVLGGVGFIVVGYRQETREALIEFLFPHSWTFAVELLLDRFFERQQQTVLVNAVVAGGLLVVSMSLFWLKELVSESFEVRGNLTQEAPSEFPLWKQFWEEVKLFALFVAAQGAIFWIGYEPDPWNQRLASVLSYLFLFASFAIDFVSPIFQRHGGSYNQILKTLAKHPVSCLLFGAMFSLPAVLAAKAWAANPHWSWNQAIFVIFGANILGIAWAAVAGTVVGARMLPVFERTKPASTPLRLVCIGLVVSLLGFHAYRFGSLGRSIYRKTQILKVDYDVDLASFGVDWPSLSFTPELGVHFDVSMTNHTGIDVEIEDNRIVVEHAGEEVARTRISPIAVPDGQSVTQTVGFTVSISPMQLRKGRDLFAAEKWTITLYLEVDEGFEFPVYLLTGQ